MGVRGGMGDGPTISKGGSIGEVIRQQRAALGLTLAQVAARVGCARSYLCMIESGARGGRAGELVDPELLAGIERALELQTGSLTLPAQWSATPAGVKREVRAIETSQRAAAAALRAVLSEPHPETGEAGVPRSIDEAFRSGRLHALVTRLERAAGVEPAGGTGTEARRALWADGRLPAQIPLINSVAAGYPREFTDLGYPARVADEYVLSPDVDDPDAFGARVVGDSMLPEYRAGDIVVFSPAKGVKSGSDCFVRLERDDETTFKRVVFQEPAPGGSLEASAPIRLVPLNPAFQERTVAREDIAFMCPAVSVTRRIG